MDVTLEDLRRAAEKEPSLTSYGIGVPDARRHSREEQEQLFARGREELLRALDGFTAACRWLALQQKRKTINEDRTSYGYKHEVEAWSRDKLGMPVYVGNGAFIAAAIHMGFSFKTYPDDPNVCLNISKRLAS